MIDPISATPVSATPRAAAVARPAPTPATAPVSDPRQDAPPRLAALAQTLGAAPPVDKERVAQIKAAIADGTFPILPATIADSLLAMRYEWMSDDKA